MVTPESLRHAVRSVLIVPVFALLSACGGGNDDPAQGGELDPPPPVTSGAWQLVWEDEFEGNSLDAASWDVQVGNGESEGIPGWGNNELQYYRAENLTVADGVLTIEARNETVIDGFGYTSGRIRTQGKVDFTYGRVEGRIKVPSGQGLWSAFWLLGTDPSPYGQWPAKGEIDIMEKYLPNFYSSAVHFGSYGPQHRFVTGTYEEVDVADEFHTYAVEWDSEFIRFFIDGENFYTINKQTYYNYYYGGRDIGFVEGVDNAPFDEDQHIILNLAVGGNLPGTPSDPAVFPARMEVDYVRLYECPVNSETGLGCEDSIDPVNPYINFDVPAEAPVISQYSLYQDGVAALFEGTDLERQLGLAVFDNEGAFSATEVSTEQGSAIELRTSGGGNVSISDPNGATFSLVNMGSVAAPASTADFKFMAKIITADTDMDGVLQVKFDSGFPDVAMAQIPLSELPQDEWGMVSVPVEEILLGGQGFYGGGPANVGELVNLVTFELPSAGVMQIADLRLDCGGANFCGIQAVATGPLTVFDDEVAAQWDRGIIGFDTAVGSDYSTAQGNHVSWEVVDSGDAERGTVIETTISDSGASGLTFIASTAGVDITPWSDGELAFDVKVISNPNNFPIVYKVDGTNGGADSGTGDQSLGVLPVGEWQTIRVPVSSLGTKGLDLTAVGAFALFPTFAGQDVVYQWGNVRFEPTLSVAPEPVIVPIDFEAPLISYSFVNFEGGAGSVVANPDVSDGNTSAQVAQFQKFAGAAFAGSVLLLDEPVDFSAGEVFTLKVWSSRAANLTFKLEGLNIERVIPLAGTGWETVQADFSGATAGTPVEGLTFIFDNGTIGDAAGDAANWTFYVDDIALQGEPVDPNVVLTADFEGTDLNAPTIGGGWKIFANVFQPNGDFAYNYEGAPFPAPNNSGGFSGIASGEGGAEQGDRYLNVFSDYINQDAHTSGQIVEAIVFQEFTLTEPTTGAYAFTFDAKLPTQFALDTEAGATAVAFVQLLDPANGFATVGRAELDLGPLLTSDSWVTLSIELALPGTDATGLRVNKEGQVGVANNQGLIVQYGFSNRATNNASTGVLFDNIAFRKAEEAPGGGNTGGTAATIQVPLSFESDVTDYRFTDFEGGVGSVVDNPGADELNPSLAVMRMQKFAGAPFAGTTLQLDVAVDFAGGEVFAIKVLSNRAANLTFKLEGLNIEKVIPVSGGAWETVYADFTGLTGGTAVNGLTIIFDNGTAGDAENDANNWTFYIDDIEIVAEVPVLDGGGLAVPAAFLFSDDFELAGTAEGTIPNGWRAFINRFTAEAAYIDGYPVNPAPNGPQISALVTGEGGAEQGTQYLSVYSNYDDPHHGVGLMETNVFREYTIAATDSGTYTFSFDAKRPLANAVVDPSSALGFIKILNPNAGFAAEVFEVVDMTDISQDEWTRYGVTVVIDGNARAGHIIQFGFSNTATNYNPSAVFYDNVSVTAGGAN